MSDFTAKPSPDMIIGAMSRLEPPPAADGPDTLSPPIRCQLRGKVDEATERLALRAVLATARLLGLAAGTHLRQLRNLNDPLARMQARIEEAQLHARLAWEIVELLSARFRKLPEKQRPHYSPSQRFRALEIRNLLGWSRELAARVFLVCRTPYRTGSAPPILMPGPSARP